jgi:hypothetical protein
MKKRIIAILLLTGLTINSQAQNRLDSLLNSLNNKDLYIAPIVGGINIGIKKSISNKDSLMATKRFFAVSSLDRDILELAGEYSKHVLAEKLYSLLQDTARDLYANALLYDLLDNRKLGKLLYMTREKWVSSGRKINDSRHWQQYMEKNIYVY